MKDPEERMGCLILNAMVAELDEEKFYGEEKEEVPVVEDFQETVEFDEEDSDTILTELNG